MSDQPVVPPTDPAVARRIFDARFILGLLVVVLSFGLLVLVGLKVIPIDQAGVAMAILTAAVGFIKDVLQWNFGSSSGSAEKSDTLNALVKKG